MPDVSIAHSVEVKLADRSYAIHIGSGVMQHVASLIPTISSYSQAIIVSDDQVAPLYLAPLQTALSEQLPTHAITLPAGEATKSFAQLEGLLSQILAFQPDRHTLLVALGGGVIGDITGFASSIVLRGIDFVQIPTTLLSQVDSSVGGKTGINSPYGKNLIGSFYQPKAVMIDSNSIATLPMRERLAGYAEIVKYGCISQPAFFDWLEQHGTDVLNAQADALHYAIATSCRAKAAIVSADERESGQRALLNLGHTFGHALEAELGYDGRLLHGEAVAIGIIMAYDLSIRLGLCDAAVLPRLRRHWQHVGLPTDMAHIPHAWDAARLVQHMQHDKKVVKNTMTFILARAIGETMISRNVTEDDLLTLLADYC